MTNLSVVIPAYNEAHNIYGGILAPVQKYLDDHFQSSEIIVVDDGSNDLTKEAAENQGLRVIRTKHYGKAHAIITGALTVQYPLVLVCDLDQSTPIKTLDKFIPSMFPHWMIYGQRPLIRAGQSKSRTLLTLGQLITRSILFPELGFIDTQCGFKLWWADHLLKVINHLDIFHPYNLDHGTSANVNSGFDVECMLVAGRLGIGLCGIPVEWTGKPSGRVHFYRDANRGLRDLLAIKKAQIAGAYDYHAVLAG